MHFIRHGQSEFNHAYDTIGIDPNIPDAPLTPQGRQQARRAGRQLAGKGITRVIASPYTRALQTASIIAEEINVPLHVEPLIGERVLYSCDIGTPARQLRADWPHLDFSAIIDDNWWPQLGESAQALTRRVAGFTEKWSPHAVSGDIAIVSHWYFLNALTGRDFANGEVHFKKIC